MSRPVETVMIEALVIGLMNAALFYALKSLQIHVSFYALLILCGALIHIIFEYTGGNQWWCKKTY